MTPPNTFTGAALDRAGDRRRDDAGSPPSAPTRPRARWSPGRDGVHVRPATARLALVPLARGRGGEPLLLGLDDGGPVFAAEGAASTAR